MVPTRFRARVPSRPRPSGRQCAAIIATADPALAAAPCGGGAAAGRGGGLGHQAGAGGPVLPQSGRGTVVGRRALGKGSRRMCESGISWRKLGCVGARRELLQDMWLPCASLAHCTHGCQHSPCPCPLRRASGPPLWCANPWCAACAPMLQVSGSLCRCVDELRGRDPPAHPQPPTRRLRALCTGAPAAAGNRAWRWCD